jgi:hypothetical protein
VFQHNYRAWKRSRGRAIPPLPSPAPGQLPPLPEGIDPGEQHTGSEERGRGRGQVRGYMWRGGGCSSLLPQSLHLCDMELVAFLAGYTLVPYSAQHLLLPYVASVLQAAQVQVWDTPLAEDVVAEAWERGGMAPR